MTVKLCRECRYVDVQVGRLSCSEPHVNAGDAYALSSKAPYAGASCMAERDRIAWWAPCGKRGRRWEKREANLAQE